MLLQIYNDPTNLLISDVELWLLRCLLVDKNMCPEYFMPNERPIDLETHEARIKEMEALIIAPVIIAIRIFVSWATLEFLYKFVKPALNRTKKSNAASKKKTT